LSRYAWPGNVRELRAVLESMFVMGDAQILSCEELPADINMTTINVNNGLAGLNTDQPDTSSGIVNNNPPATATLDGLECEAIRKELVLHKGNRSKVARNLGISRSTLYRKIKNHGLADD